MKTKGPSTVATIDENCCTMCGYRSDGSLGDRVRHLRGSHPAVARGLLLRLAAPLGFVGILVLLAVAHAPQWAYLGALALTMAVIAAGAMTARRDTSRTSPRLKVSEMLRRGGFRFVLFGVAAVVLLIASTR